MSFIIGTECACYVPTTSTTTTSTTTTTVTTTTTTASQTTTGESFVTFGVTTGPGSLGEGGGGGSA